jgi:hypothetical protein
MTKDKMIDKVLDGLETDIQNWAANDSESLIAWLYDTLGLARMTKVQLKRRFSAYLPEEEGYQAQSNHHAPRDRSLLRSTS